MTRNDHVKATATERSSRCLRHRPISRVGRGPNQVPGSRGFLKAMALDPQAGRPHLTQDPTGMTAPCSRINSLPITYDVGGGAWKVVVSGIGAADASGGTGTITRIWVAGAG